MPVRFSTLVLLLQIRSASSFNLQHLNFTVLRELINFLVPCLQVSRTLWLAVFRANEATFAP